MHTPSLFVASVAVLSSFATAEPERPKFYFPRQVKRQIFSNSTITTNQATLPAAQTTSDFVSSSRRSLSDLLSGLTSNGQSSPAGATGNILGNSISTLQPTYSSPPSSASGLSVGYSNSIDGVTTVVVPQTVIVGSDTSASTVEVGTTPTATPATTPTTTPAATADSSSPSATLADETVFPYLLSSALDTPAAASLGAAPSIIVQPTTASTSDDITATSEAPAAASLGAAPSIIVQPTTASTNDDITATSEAPAAASSMSGILLAPGGVVTTSGSAAAASSIATASAEPPAAESVTSGVLYSGTAASTAPAAPAIVPILSNADSALSGVVATPAPTISPTESSAPTTIAGISGLASTGILAPELLTTAAAPSSQYLYSSFLSTPTDTSAPISIAAAASSSQDYLLPLLSTPPDASAPSQTAGISGSASPGVTTTTDVPWTDIGPSAAASATDIGPPAAASTTDLNSILSSIFGSTTSALSSVETASASISGLPLSDLPTLGLPTSATDSSTAAASTPIPTYSAVSTPTSPADSSSITGSATSSADSSIITGSAVSTPAGSAQSITYAADNSTSISGATLAGSFQTGPTTGTAASTTASTSSSLSIDTSASTNSTSAGILAMPSATSMADYSSVAPVTSIDSTNAPSSSSAAPVTTSTTPQSITPIGSNTATSMEIPSTIVVQPSPTFTYSATATAMPTGLPLVIVPEGGTPAAPEDSTLIQLGFLFPLNYQFVVANSTSSLQIFAYLPQCIADGLSLKPGEIVMHSLIPYNTQASLGYITTIALAFIPTNMVTTLQLDLHIPMAAIYNNPDVTLNTLANYINPAIPITGSLTGGSGASGTDSSSVATSGVASGNGGVFNPDSQDQTPAVEGATAGIVVGAVGAAAAYGAAMFFVARRYKRRKQGHRRSSSIQSPAGMRQSGSQALMGGAFLPGGRRTPSAAPTGRDSRGSGRSAGNSARTQQISAPMMAENSLGWN